MAAGKDKVSSAQGKKRSRRRGKADSWIRKGGWEKKRRWETTPTKGWRKSKIVGKEKEANLTHPLGKKRRGRS